MTDSRPHILVVIAGVQAGTGTFCRSLGTGLRRFHGAELKVSLLTFRTDARLPENAACFDETYILGSEVRSGWGRALDLPRGLLRLRDAAEQIQPDLIFTIGTFSNVVASLAIDRVPIVLSEHLNMTHRLGGARFGGITAWFMRKTYRDHLMAVASRELAGDLHDHFKVRRSVVIPNGIDASAVRARAQEPAAPPPVSRYMIWVGRLTQQKDVATLLRAYALAKARSIADDLLIAGDGEQRTMLESLAADLGIRSRVHFLGHCPNPYPLIKGARAMVLSSIWEGFAYVPIEAMALDVPVISTACPSGPAEILGGGEYGMLVPPRDPEKLADAMLTLSSDDALYAQLSAKSARRAAQLSIEAMAQQYRDVFISELQSARG